jgi:hypothetical protein
MSHQQSEQFHATLIAQYKELIHVALLESDHLMFLDQELFDKKLQAIVKAASVDGLTKGEIMLLVEEARTEIPSHPVSA